MHQYIKFLTHIRLFHPKLQADFCRENAKLIAESASRGHITSLNFWGEATNRWELTYKAYDILKACE